MLKFACLALCALLALPAAAQETAPTTEEPDATPVRLTNGQQIGAWRVACEAVAVGETNCVLSQRLVRASDDAFLADLLAFWNGDLTTMFLAARVPMGVYLPSGFVIGTDGSPDEIALIWQSCAQQLCEALLELDEATRDRLDGATEVTVGYRPTVTADPAIFNIDSAGLKEGLDLLRRALGGT